MEFYIERFRGMETLPYTVEIVTPMFLGGADPKEAELRVPSIKGALRFWWRAKYGCDDLASMKKREDEIFGSTNRKASFSLCFENSQSVKSKLENLPCGRRIPVTSKGKKFSISIIEYLAYGLKSSRDQHGNIFTKKHFTNSTKFSLILNIKNNDFKEQILDSLRLLAKYGGLGARSRNGFGSICIENLKLSNDLDRKGGELKSFTAFSKESKLFESKNDYAKWDEALSDIGVAYRSARCELENKHSFNKRQLIAKPIIVRGEVNIEGRHAKPYFLHIKKQNSKYIGQILFMPYMYCDDSKYLDVCKSMNSELSKYLTQKEEF